MVALKISMFGTGVYSARDHAVAHTLDGPAGRLLARLVMSRGRPLRREALASELWSDTTWDTARRRLNATVYRLRSQIETTLLPSHIITPTAQEITFDRESDYWFDVEQFERAATAVLETPYPNDAIIADFERALDLYAGPLCPTIDEDWINIERTRLANLYVAALTSISAFHLAKRRPRPSLDLAQRALAADPLREDVYRLAMRGLAAIGHRSGALSLFERCKTTLAQELDVEPLPETTRLAAAISLGGRPPDASDRPADPATIDARLVLAQTRLDMLEMVERLDIALGILDPTPHHSSR